MPLRPFLTPTDSTPPSPPPSCTGKPSTPPAHGAQASQSSPLPPLRRSAQIKQQMRAMALQTQETDNLHPTLFANPLYKPPAQVKVRRRQIGTDAQLFAGKSRGGSSLHVWRGEEDMEGDHVAWVGRRQGQEGEEGVGVSDDLMPGVVHSWQGGGQGRARVVGAQATQGPTHRAAGTRQVIA